MEKESPKKLKKGLNRGSSEDDSKAEDKIIEQLISRYNDDGDGNGANGDCRDLLGNTIENLRENIRENICLICIEDVEKKEAVWSCQVCFCILHLVCIQRWAKENISNVKEAAKLKGFNLPIIWCCPKCRFDYSEDDFPNKYKCFCSKVESPEFDPWNIPHSCGNTCNKPLLPLCGHFCLIPCHSGPCPPCPKQMITSCFCGKSADRPLRCYQKEFSCNRVCNNELKCNHLCTQQCHKNDCNSYSCEEEITISCYCYTPSTFQVTCSTHSDPEFEITCGKKCGKVLNCGVHECTVPCHEGPCQKCLTTCPCGKSKVDCVQIPGLDKTSGKPCGSTCLKPLDCSIHYCEQRCHLSDCGVCLQLIYKLCRCGSSEKEVNCSKEYVCSNKCKRNRDCGVHQCNKKCCSGECPPCANICGKTLACKNHKCLSICHRGPCFPCPVSAPVKCRCGKTVKYVPCGSEKKTKPPTCYLPCERPSKCDHEKIQKHKCHRDECPKCSLICNKKLSSCGHICPKSCHTYKLNKKDCPKCMVQVPSKCEQHSNILVECYKVTGPTIAKCEEICDRDLSCGHHKCQKKCHVSVIQDCGKCMQDCSLPRPEECDHQCELGCHEGKCQDCIMVAKIPCHCESETLYIICSHQSTMTSSKKSCKNQCPKKLSCSHRCLAICHPEPCPELDRCRRRVKIICKCKSYKAELECYLVEKKVVDCSPTTCNNIPKSPKEPTTPGQSSTTRKRPRKKKNSESEQEQNAPNTAADTEQIDAERKDQIALVRKTYLKYFGIFLILLVTIYGVSYFL